MTENKKRAPTLYAIIFVKLGKGLLFLMLALGVFSLIGHDLPADFQRLVRWLNLDPERQMFVQLEKRLSLVTPSNVGWVASGTMLYGLLSVAEGVGLVFRLAWVGWLVACESALLIPYEVYKLFHRFSWGLAAILAINVWIFWYLVQNRHRLFRHRRTEV